MKTLPSSRAVLLVEDDSRVRDAVTHELSLHCVECVAVVDRVAARLLMSSNRFDAIVLDLTVRGEGVSHLIADVSRDLGTPLIVLVGDEDPDPSRWLDLGADGYLRKPPSARELSARLRAIWRRSDRMRRVPNDPRRFHH